MLREDGSGAIEYYYGNLGEVLKTVRTLIVPNQAVATYVTQWKYDSHNRLLEMIYPDEEKVTYGYNLGGQVEKVSGYKTTHYDCVSKIGYDKFEQRTYLKYCNGAETFYAYDPQRRRLQNLAVNAGGKTIMDNAYGYDVMSNVLSVVNKAAIPEKGKAGGQMSHSYTYDPLYRLSTASGTYKGADNKTASYTLAMGYDNMHRITSKKQHLTQSNVQFNGTLNAGYDLTYTYNNDEGKKFQLASVRDINYRTEETPTDSTSINNGHKYTYDANGNLVYINTSRVKHDGKEDEKATEQKYKWDEENRLLAADENGFVSNYWYDADGERTVKTSGENEAIFVNSEFSGGNTGTARFSLYVSPYLVAGQGGKYTKHIYVGSQRIVSKLGDLASYGADPRKIPYAGNEADGVTINYKDKYNQQLQSIKDNYKTFDLPYNGQDNPDYVNGKGFSSDDDTPEAAQARAMARTRAANGNFKPNDDYEKMQFYYHPDHLGSSSYITNLDGEVSQHIEYVPFGEVFLEERNNTWNTPYLFNAKELDEETGMYYYGARYYEPRLSLWMSVDPISNYDPRNSENYLDGEHNGGVYNSYNLYPYGYCYQNPIRLIDPNGKQVDVTITDKVVGHADIRLIVPKSIKNAPQTMRVPLYQAIVSDATTKEQSEYAVTRDALWAIKSNKEHIFVQNSAFEPRTEVGNYGGMIVDYPENSGLKAVLLLNAKGTNKLEASLDRTPPPGGVIGFASSVMLHVGGEYQRKDGKTYITGSFGCSGVYKQKDGQFIGGNEAVTDFINDIQGRQSVNKDKSLQIQYISRDAVNWRQNIDSVNSKTDE